MSKPLKVRFKRKNLCDGFINDCLNFADDSIYFYLFLGRMESLLYEKDQGHLVISFQQYWPVLAATTMAPAAVADE